MPPSPAPCERFPDCLDGVPSGGTTCGRLSILRLRGVGLWGSGLLTCLNEYKRIHSIGYTNGTEYALDQNTSENSEKYVKIHVFL